MRKITIDHENVQVAFAEMINQEWKNRRVIGDKVPNGSMINVVECIKNG